MRARSALGIATPSVLRPDRLVLLAPGDGAFWGGLSEWTMRRLRGVPRMAARNGKFIAHPTSSHAFRNPSFLLVALVLNLDNGHVLASPVPIGMLRAEPGLIFNLGCGLWAVGHATDHPGFDFGPALDGDFEGGAREPNRARPERDCPLECHRFPLAPLAGAQRADLFTRCAGLPVHHHVSLG